MNLSVPLRIPNNATAARLARGERVTLTEWFEGEMDRSRVRMKRQMRRGLWPTRGGSQRPLTYVDGQERWVTLMTARPKPLRLEIMFCP